jgi:hypothetical protein
LRVDVALGVDGDVAARGLGLLYRLASFRIHSPLTPFLRAFHSFRTPGTAALMTPL